MQSPMGQSPSQETDKEKIEEITEAIVEEKWKEKEREIKTRFTRVNFFVWKRQITQKTPCK